MVKHSVLFVLTMYINNFNFIHPKKFSPPTWLLGEVSEPRSDWTVAPSERLLHRWSSTRDSFASKATSDSGRGHQWVVG